MPRTIYTTKDPSSKEKREDYIRNKAEGIKEAVSDFYHEHEAEIKYYTPIAASVLITGLKFASSNKKTKDERFHETTIYDRSEGHYWYLKKKPSNHQWAEISRRHENGESYRRILTDMNLLKR